MTLNTKTGQIGFASSEGDLGSYSQWWKPVTSELLEFGEDALFWSSVPDSKFAEIVKVSPRSRGGVQ